MKKQKHKYIAVTKSSSYPKDDASRPVKDCNKQIQGMDLLFLISILKLFVLHSEVLDTPRINVLTLLSGYFSCRSQCKIPADF